VKEFIPKYLVKYANSAIGLAIDREVLQEVSRETIVDIAKSLPTKEKQKAGSFTKYRRIGHAIRQSINKKDENTKKRK
jgi:hypothetical protein